MHDLKQLAVSLRNSMVFKEKNWIDVLRRQFGDAFDAWGIDNGDDCAAIPQPNGEWLLLAAEGIIPSLVSENPELAGRSAVLANVNDIYAMGGRPLAMVDVVGTRDEQSMAKLCRGMKDNALRFHVPIVGGHVQHNESDPFLAMAILGRAKSLVTSFDARAGDRIVLVTNLDGIWLEDSNFWNCTLARQDESLVGNLELLPKAAEAGLVHAGKDVSMAGIAGTTIMLCEGSRVGADIRVDDIPMPPQYGREKIELWMRAFFSYGFLLAVPPANVGILSEMFKKRNLAASVIGEFVQGSNVMLSDSKGNNELLTDWNTTPFTGFRSKQ